eukprot:6793134-Alexandrium_andersonii.AAC.1
MFQGAALGSRRVNGGRVIAFAVRAVARAMESWSHVVLCVACVVAGQLSRVIHAISDGRCARKCRGIRHVTCDMCHHSEPFNHLPGSRDPPPPLQPPAQVAQSPPLREVAPVVPPPPPHAEPRGPSDAGVQRAPPGSRSFMFAGREFHELIQGGVRMQCSSHQGEECWKYVTFGKDHTLDRDTCCNRLL